MLIRILEGVRVEGFGFEMSFYNAGFGFYGLPLLLCFWSGAVFLRLWDEGPLGELRVSTSINFLVWTETGSTRILECI